MRLVAVLVSKTGLINRHRTPHSTLITIIIWKSYSIIPQIGELNRLKTLSHKKKTREHFAITAAILRACEERALRTHVLYLSGISSEMLHGYIDSALKAGLLMESALDRSLFITTKGRLFLKNYEVIESLLADEDLRQNISQ